MASAFGKVVACLSRIGEDLYFEPRQDEVSTHVRRTEERRSSLSLSLSLSLPLHLTQNLPFYLSLQLTLRTVNSSRSAYACYNFLPSFFESYTILPVDGEYVLSCPQTKFDRFFLLCFPPLFFFFFFFLFSQAKHTDRWKLPVSYSEPGGLAEPSNGEGGNQLRRGERTRTDVFLLLPSLSL
jgi:hypothetical protein